LLSHYLKLIS